MDKASAAIVAIRTAQNEIPKMSSHHQTSTAIACQSHRHPPTCHWCSLAATTPGNPFPLSPRPRSGPAVRGGLQVYPVPQYHQCSPAAGQPETGLLGRGGKGDTVKYVKGNTEDDEGSFIKDYLSEKVA